MNPFPYDYAVIGGDLRQVYLADELAKSNASVCHYALSQPSNLSSLLKNSVSVTSLETACSSAVHIIGPIPLSRDGVHLNQNSIKKNISLKYLLSLLQPSQHFFAGCIPKEFRKKALEKNILVSDFMQDMTLSYFNTIATAEGILCEAIKASPKNLHHSRCAVLGYGKCGLTLTNDLKKMCCHVSVVTSPEEELAKAALVADDIIPLHSFSRHIGEYDFIFNTIPSITMTKEVLSFADPSVMILDIASAPGGVDLAAAKELSIHAASYPGLPGKYAPLSSAQAIKESIQKFECPANTL